MPEFKGFDDWADPAWILFHTASGTYYRQTNSGLMYVKKQNANTVANGTVYGTFPVGRRPLGEQEITTDAGTLAHIEILPTGVMAQRSSLGNRAFDFYFSTTAA